MGIGGVDMMKAEEALALANAYTDTHGGGGGTSDYSQLSNQPKVNNVTLIGNKTSSDLGLMPEYEVDTTPTESSDNLITSGGVWTADKGIKDRLQGSKTATGNPITITDAESMNAESVVVELEPKQDLHGYDKPWAGGVGKNKLPLVLADIKSANTSGTWSGNTYTLNGVTFEVLTDSADNVEGIKVNGLASASTLFSTPNFSANGNYIVNGCPSGGSNDTYRIDVRSSSGVVDIDTGAGKEIYNVTYDIYCAIRIEGGYTANNLTFYPMIRLSTESDATFEPYSNISPISGYSEVNIERDGDTYTIELDGTIYGGILDVTNGVLTVDRTIVEYDGSVDESWDGNNDIHGISIPSDCQIEQTPISDAFRGVSPRAYTQVNVGEIALNPSYTNINLRYIEDGLSVWKDYLSNNPLQVCYELATPLTIQLTPTQIQMLENTNNISTDGTNMQLKYQPKNTVLAEAKRYTNQEIAKLGFPQPPTTDGTYHLECSVSGGIPTIRWVLNS